MSRSAQQKQTQLNRGRPSFDVTDADTAEAFRRIASQAHFDRSSEVSLWVQLKNLLEHHISRGVLEPDSRLPSELAMAEMFKLSRPVVRNALSALVSEGLIVKQPRKGIFVAEPPKQIGFMTSAIGVFDDLRAKGIEVQARTYEFGLFDANDEEQKALRLPRGFGVIRFVRVYVVEGRPITHSRISLPAHRVPGMESFDMENNSIFGTMRERFGLTVAYANRQITAKVADSLISERLEIEIGAPLIHIVSTAYDHKDLPLEHYRSFYNAEVAPINLSVDARF